MVWCQYKFCFMMESFASFRGHHLWNRALERAALVFPFGRPQGCYLVPTLRWLKHLLCLTIWTTISKATFEKKILFFWSETTPALLLCFQAIQLRLLRDNWCIRKTRENKPKSFQKQPPYSLVQPWSGIVADGLVYLSSDIFSYSVVHWLQVFHRGHSKVLGLGVLRPKTSKHEGKIFF